MASRRTTKLALVVAAVVVALDLATKELAVATLDGRGRVDLLGGHLHLELYRNFAGPGGSFDGHVVLISLFTLIAVAAIAFAATRVQTRLAALAAGLLLGGGVGNLLDRLLRDPGPLHGGVVDWLKPTLDGGSMNLADLSLNLAFLLVVCAGLLELIRPRGPEASGSTPPRAGSSGASGR